MKVLLTQDVKGKGKAGDIINANDGYARNFLIPRGLAVAADANNIHAANLKKQADVHRREVARQNARALADEMKGLTVKVYAKAGKRQAVRLNRRGRDSRGAQGAVRHRRG